MTQPFAMDQFSPLFPNPREVSPISANPPLLKVHPVQDASEAFYPAAPHPAADPAARSCPAGAAPELTFMRSADRITQIRIKCACGQITVLDCDYGDAADAKG